MSARFFSTSEEARIDRLARDLLGTERDGMVEALLAANPDLAAHGPFVAAGTNIAVPDADRPPARILKTVDPWD